MTNIRRGSFSFRPKARLLRTLGEELISSESVAVIELVKNAYDADASRVLIQFSEELNKGDGNIEIIDDGHGMSINIVENAWMQPATNNKRKQTHSNVLNRRMLGEKGIGRFASARIAEELELITREIEAENEIYALFDWSQFEDEDTYLDEITVLAEQRTPEEIKIGGTIDKLWTKRELTDSTERNHGTILRMSRFKKSWTTDDFQELHRGLSRLISPFSPLENFKIRIEIPQQSSVYSAVDISPPEVIKHPHYVVKASVSENGEYDLLVTIVSVGQDSNSTGRFIRSEKNRDLLPMSIEHAEERIKGLSATEIGKLKPECGPFSLELRIWDRDELGNVAQITDSPLKDIRKDLDSVAGVNIYRDAFRVLPYGEPKDDWLRLDIRRVQNPTYRLSNNQIVGYVSITADENPNLVDQSNREGLYENQALSDLRQILLYFLSFIEDKRYKLRREQREDKTKKAGLVQGLFTSINLGTLREAFRQRHPEDQQTIKLINEIEGDLAKQVSEIQNVLARYQTLAVLGTLIDVVLHDGRLPLSKIKKEAILGQEDIQETALVNDKLLPKLVDRFSTIEIQGDALSTIFRRIEPFAGRKRGRPALLYLEKVISDAFDILQSEIQKLGVQVLLPDTQTLVSVDSAEIQQVILNLLGNSLYWLEYVPKDNRQILVTVKRVMEHHIEIVFSDSGPGVPSEYRERIFEPYFSKKPNGIGLGLAISGEIVSDYYDGELELLDNAPLGGATFRITLRKRV